MFGINIESLRHRGADKREEQFGMEGGIGKLSCDMGKLAEDCNILLNVVPSLAGTTSKA